MKKSISLVLLFSSKKVILYGYIYLEEINMVSPVVNVSVMKALGLCTTSIGVVGFLNGENELVLIASMV